jgi:hypothetical protein
MLFLSLKSTIMRRIVAFLFFDLLKKTDFPTEWETIRKQAHYPSLSFDLGRWMKHLYGKRETFVNSLDTKPQSKGKTVMVLQRIHKHSRKKEEGKMGYPLREL